ncbi:MAG: aminotransferase class I/II-fold pyridoxal phosphate-dependent enzyme [Hamadaea sp.]|nr:aminotransferase class I/II-fold pyridoxal phosphate-dependent enzyme [Hamadaea sp.]
MTVPIRERGVRLGAANLTELEIRAERAGLNLADGHARQPLTPAQEAIVDRLPELFRTARRGIVPDLDREAQETYLSALGQHTALTSAEILSCYSSSVAMEILARAASAAGLRRVGLIHPTFDNIPDILRGVGLDLAAVPESVLHTADTGAAPEVDVLFVTTPNNPTGAVLEEDALARWAAWCAEHGVVLALDTSFRAFDPRAQYDHYRVLVESGAEWVVIEDTGKVFPSLDLKVGFLAYARGGRLPLWRIYTDILLGVSPAILCLVTALARDGAAGGIAALHGLMAHHRAVLHAVLPAPAYHWPDPGNRISVERLVLPVGLEADRVCADLRARDVHVLPGGHFHWADPAAGAGYLRIALSRPEKDVTLGAEIIRDYLEAATGR